MTRDRRDSYLTIPEGRMAVDRQQTLLWMEIGEHAFYHLGPHDRSMTIIEIRCSQTLIRDIPYLEELGLKVSFFLESQLTASKQAEADAGVDELIGVRRESAKPPVFPRLSYTFVKLENVPRLRNVKRMWVRPNVSFSQHSQSWLMQIDFPNIMGVPRLLRPSDRSFLLP